MGVGRGRAVARLAGAVMAVAATLFPPAQPAANAAVTGSCEASIAGRSITTGHDAPGSAIHVNYRIPFAYAGRTTDGQQVSRVDVKIEVLGLGIRAVHQPASGSTWSSTVRIDRCAWAGVGLYRVRGTAFAGSRPVCAGSVFICVTGKSPFFTVVGGLGGAVVLLGILLMVMGFRRRRLRPRSSLARRWGSAGLLGGVGGAVLLQQTCVAALTPATVALAAGGGLIGLVILSFLVPTRVGVPPSAMGPPPASPPPVSPPPSAPPPSAPPPAPPPAVPPPPNDPDPKVRTMYQFVAAPGACRACQNHAAHRVYDSPASITPNRPHVGCKCSITPQQIDSASYTAYFYGGRTIYDDRKP
jgi:hypothetical protein